MTIDSLEFPSFLSCFAQLLENIKSNKELYCQGFTPKKELITPEYFSFGSYQANNGLTFFI